jgi:hypothetical protein
MTTRSGGFILLTALAFLASCSQPAGEQQQAAGAIDVLAATESSRDFGDYVVHFNALTTDQLTPDIARQYAIVRSENRALLNISILRKQENGAQIPVSGAVAASAVNLTGQLKNLLMREIREQEAIYYIAEIPIANGETLVFTVDATPQNEASRFTVRFQKQFYTN